MDIQYDESSYEGHKTPTKKGKESERNNYEDNFNFNNGFNTPTSSNKKTQKRSMIPQQQQEFYEKSNRKNFDFESPVSKRQVINESQYQFSTPPKKNNDNPQSKRQNKQGDQQYNQYIYQSPKKTNTKNKNNDRYSSGYKNIQNNKQNSNKNSNNKKISEFNLTRFDTDYQIIKTLGEGCFSSVHLCKSKLTGDLVAIKETKLASSKSMSINQVQALGTLSIFAEKSKNIVKYYHSWSQDGSFYIVMQYCQGNLTNLFKSYKSTKKSVPELEIKKYLKQALLGLKCMHENRMVHLDIKPDNLLFKTIVHQGTEEKVLKIADLGLCRVSRIKRWSELQEGDSRYLAKQVLNYHEGIDLTKADIFSLGMSFYQGLTLQNLPNNGQKWMHIRQSGLPLSLTQNYHENEEKSRNSLKMYSRELKEIIRLMTSPDWNDRPSAEELLKLKYFQQNLLFNNNQHYYHHQVPLRRNNMNNGLIFQNNSNLSNKSGNRESSL